jgi:hypothetical protein
MSTLVALVLAVSGLVTTERQVVHRWEAAADFVDVVASSLADIGPRENSLRRTQASRN